MSRSAIAGLYGHYMFSFFKKLPNSSRVAVPFYIPNPVSSQLCQHLVVLIFFILAILASI